MVIYVFQKFRRTSRGVLFFSENVTRFYFYEKLFAFSSILQKIVVKYPIFLSPRFARGSIFQKTKGAGFYFFHLKIKK